MPGTAKHSIIHRAAMKAVALIMAASCRNVAAVG
jgi:hypothetical protein